MNKVLPVLAIALLLAAILWLVPSETVVAEVVDIPIDLPQKENAPINEQYYTSDLSYEDPSISIRIEKGGVAYNTPYVIAYVKIASPTQIRRALSNRNGQNAENATIIPKGANALLAITGDSFHDNKQEVGKYIVWQGQVMQHNIIESQSHGYFRYFDSLVIDDQGDLYPFMNASTADLETFEETHGTKIVNAFAFGPAIIINGERRPELTNSYQINGVGWFKRAQRIALCQTGKLEYMIVVTGSEDNGRAEGVSGKATGMTMDEFTDLLLSFGNVQTAYCMDGGSSAWMVFRGEKVNDFGGKKRPIGDILYFVSAWRED